MSLVHSPRWYPVYCCRDCPYRIISMQRPPYCSKCDERSIPDECESLEDGFPEWCTLNTASDVAKREDYR